MQCLHMDGISIINSIRCAVILRGKCRRLSPAVRAIYLTVNRMVAGSNPARGAIAVDTISPVTSTRMLPIADNCFMACLKVARRSWTSAAPVITEVQ